MLGKTATLNVGFPAKFIEQGKEYVHYAMNLADDGSTRKKLEFIGPFEAETTNEYLDRFVERKRGEGGDSTVNFYKTVRKCFLKWLGEERAAKDLATIRPQDIVRYRNFLLEKLAQSTTTNRIKAIEESF